jgi:hypothetical protein
MLGFPADKTYGIIVGAAHSARFQTDATLNRIAAELRRSFMLGVTQTRTTRRPLWE